MCIGCGADRRPERQRLNNPRNRASHAVTEMNFGLPSASRLNNPRNRASHAVTEMNFGLPSASRLNNPWNRASHAVTEMNFGLPSASRLNNPRNRASHAVTEMNFGLPSASRRCLARHGKPGQRSTYLRNATGCECRWRRYAGLFVERRQRTGEQRFEFGASREWLRSRRNNEHRIRAQH